MPFPRLPRLSARRICYCAIFTAAVAIVAIVAVIQFLVFSVALPMRRAYYLETDYQHELLVNKSVEPSIKGIDQLFFWRDPSLQFRTYDDVLALNHDGTAATYGAGQDVWIYLAGTAQDSHQRLNAYNHKWLKPDCDDPPHICLMYAAAFRRIIGRWSSDRSFVNHDGKTRTYLRWVDCDVSPLLCHPFWGLAGSNLLVHMKTDTKCTYGMLPRGSCGVTWRWIGLPIYQAPWTRQIRITLDQGGSTVVPAFPSAEEQMWNVMAYDGAKDAMAYDDEETYPPNWNSMITVIPQSNE